MIRVCSYARVSTSSVEQESSLETQHQIFTKWVESHKSDGYVLVNEVYEQKSGTLITKRPKFQQMIEEAKQGKYDCLLFKDSKRFSRNIEDFLILVRELNLHSVHIIFITEGLIVSNETDRTNLAFLGVMAENYSNTLHSNVQNALKIKINSELGRVPSGVYGYRRVDGDSSRAIIVESEANIIREVFNRYADGEGVSSIASDLISRDVRTYRGSHVTLWGLRRWIRNPLYKGQLIMNKYSKPSVRDKRVLNDSDDWVYRERPDLQIVTPELWNKCNEIMDANQKRLNEITDNKIGYHAEHQKILGNKPFKNILVCGDCGKRFIRKDTIHKDRAVPVHYRYFTCSYKHYNKNNYAGLAQCANSRNVKYDDLCDVLGIVIDKLVKDADSDSLKGYVYKKVTSIIEEKKKEVNKNIDEEKLKEAEDKFKRVAMLFKDAMISEDEYKAVRNEVHRLRDIVNKNLMKNDGHSVHISKDDINRIIDKFLNNLSSVCLDELRSESIDGKAFNKLFKQIVINKESIDIYFKASDNCYKVSRTENGLVNRQGDQSCNLFDIQVNRCQINSDNIHVGESVRVYLSI